MAKLFSIKDKYSQKIYSKEKLVEFRRQNINIEKDEICLIYTSDPVKKITGYFIVKEKIRTSLSKLWELTKNIAGITYNEFKDYFKDCREGTAIVFKKVKEFTKKISLRELQKKIDGFRPPQSFYNLNEFLIKVMLLEFDKFKYSVNFTE